MKLKYLFLALLPFSLMACQSIQPHQKQPHVSQQADTEQQLSAYSWTYQNSQASKPLVINFIDNHQLSIQTGCNGQGGSWKIEEGKLVTSHLISTMMACQSDLMKQEQLSSSIFNEARSNFDISLANGQAILTITDTKGQKHVFKGSKMLEHSALTSYNWTYQPEGSKEPILLNFSNDRIGIDSGCNRQGTSWKIENGQLLTGDLVSTQMACDPVLMKQEQFSSSLFQKRSIPFELNLANPAQPTLILKDTQGQSYTFKGNMTPEAQYQSQGETIFLEIAPETKSCTGVAPQTCLQVREIKYDDKGMKTQVDKDWTLFYDHIEGFKHDPNQRVIVRVKRYERKNIAADQSKYAYVHDMTVEQETIKKP